MMEPQQEILRTGLQLIVHRRIGFAILAHSIGTLRRTVETNAVGVSLMIIYRAPFQWIFSLEAIGFWTIMVVELEDMV